MDTTVVKYDVRKRLFDDFSSLGFIKIEDKNSNYLVLISSGHYLAKVYKSTLKLTNYQQLTVIFTETLKSNSKTIATISHNSKIRE